jgi:hypothetical protein
MYLVFYLNVSWKVLCTGTTRVRVLSILQSSTHTELCPLGPYCRWSLGRTVTTEVVEGSTIPRTGTRYLVPGTGTDINHSADSLCSYDI